MGIGDYSHKVTFRSYTSVADNYGGTVDTPVNVLNTFAQVVRISAARRLYEHQAIAANTVIFRIRYRKDFTPDQTMKIIWGGKEYQINNDVQIDAKRRFWEFTATGI